MLIKKQISPFLFKLISVLLSLVMVLALAPISDIFSLALSANAEQLPEYNSNYGRYTVKTVNGSTVLTAVSNYGCGFRGWYDKSGNEVCYTADFTLPSGKTADDYIPVFYDFNLVKNGGFEEYAVGTNMKNGDMSNGAWEGYNDSEVAGNGDWSSMEISNSRAKTGSKSLQIYSPSNTAYRVFENLEKNTQYTVSFWYNIDPSVPATETTKKLENYLSFVSVVADDDEITTRANFSGAPYLAKSSLGKSGECKEGEWKKVSVTFYTNENTSVKLCLLYVSDSDSANNVKSKNLFIDDLILIKDTFAAPTYVNENFSNSANYNWVPYENDRVGLEHTKDNRLKISSLWTFKNVQGPAIFFKKGAEYTISFKFDMSKVAFEQYIPAVTDDNPPKYIYDENGNYIWQTSEDGKSLLSNWINFNISNAYRTWGQQGKGNLVTDNNVKESVKITISDTSGKTMQKYSYNRSYTAVGFSKKTITDEGLDPANLIIKMTFTPDETTEGYFNVRLNSMGEYYIDDFTVTETQKTVDPTEYIKGAVSSMGTAIRTEGIQGMRHKSSFDKRLISAEMYYGIRLTEYGTLAIKTEQLGDKELVLDGEYTFNGKTYTPKKGVAYSFNNRIDKVYVNSAERLEFTGVLTNIADKHWNDDYTARAYLKYVDKDGVEGILYLDQSNIAVYPISKAAYSSKNEKGEYLEAPQVREYLYNKIISKFTDKVIKVKNASTPVATNFEGMRSTVYHATTFFPSKHGRTYTEQQAAIEMDRLVDTKIDNVRTRLASQWMWNTSTKKWDWNSTKMQAVYKWANMLKDRNITITLNAGWHLHDFIYFYDLHFNNDANKYNSTNGRSSIPEVNYLLGYEDNLTPIANAYGEDSKAALIEAAGRKLGLNLTNEEYDFYSVVAARYTEWIKQALLVFKAQGITNLKYVLPFTETGYARDGDPTYSYDEWILMVMALNDELKSAEIRNDYKFIGPSQSNYVYQNREVQFVEYIYEKINGTEYEDMIDIVSMHQYTTPNTQKGYENTIYDPYACYSRASENFEMFKQIRENAGVYNKDFWCDEYFAYANDARWHDNVPMQMTQYAAGFTAGVNNGVNRFLVWQMFDTLWDDTATHGTAHLPDFRTSNEFIGGVHAVGTCPSLVKADGETCTIEGCACKNYTPYSSYTPRKTYYGINLIGKYMNNENADVFATEVIDDATQNNGGVYVSAIKNDAGKTVIMVVNTMSTVSSFDVQLENAKFSAFERYVYDPDTIVPTSEAKSISSDKTIALSDNNSFKDILPAGTFAIYVSANQIIGDDVDMDIPEDFFE